MIGAKEVALEEVKNPADCLSEARRERIRRLLIKIAIRLNDEKGKKVDEDSVGNSGSKKNQHCRFVD